ncbi:MAG: tetratricopeptide repeat protein, partial [Candidatus Promineifilaceae bacterium]
MSNLHICCFGGLTISDGDGPLTGFHSNKSRALLCYLAVTGRSHRRSALAGFLWGDLPEVNARANLRKVLSNLRKVAGHHLLITRNEAGINPENPIWTDVSQIEGVLGAASTLDQLTEAAALYVGDFLYGFDVRDAPDFEMWSLAQRARYIDLIVDVLDRLAAHFAAISDLNTAADYAKQLLQIEPWREETHRQLIVLLAQSGQRSMALKQCAACSAVLREELGVDPTRETLALCDAVERGDLDAIELAFAAAAAFRLPTQQQYALHNLPAQSTPFIGRSTELALISDLIADADARLVTLLGAGGMGKTRLAIAAAEKHYESYRDGICFVSLAPLKNIDAIVPAVARAVGFSFYEGGSTLDQLRNFLRGKQVLLVLDSFEHLLDGGRIVDDILKHAPGVDILVTSRTKLNLQEEYILRVDGLKYPMREEGLKDLPDRVDEFDALNLFAHHAKRSRPDYALGPDDWEYIVEICSQMQGMPLGILLAAAWIELLPLKRIAVEIRSSFDFLETDLRDVPARHRSMRAVFDSTWALLTDWEKEIVSSLSVFHDAFTQRAAKVVSGASTADLMALSGKSLLVRESGGGFSMHGLIKQYSAFHLSQSSERHIRIRDRHSAFFCGSMMEREKEWKSGREVFAFEVIAAHFEDIRAAWRWAVERLQIDLLEMAMDSFSEAYSWLARYQEGETEFAWTVGNLQESLTSSKPVPDRILLVIAKALCSQGEFNREFLGQHTAAEQLFQQSQAYLEQAAKAGLDTRRAEIPLLIQLSRVERDKGNHYSSGRFWEKSMALSQELGDLYWEAYMTGGFAWGAVRARHYDEARNLFKKALSMWQSLGTTMYTVNALAGLGLVELTQGMFDESERLLRESMALDEKRGRVEKLVNLHSLLGYTLISQGEFLEAEKILESGCAFYTAIGRSDALMDVTQNLAIAYLHLGRFDEALYLGEEILDYWGQRHHSLKSGLALSLIAECILTKGDYSEAKRLLTESINILGQVKVRDETCVGWTLLGIAEHALGNTLQPNLHLEKSINGILESHSFTLLLFLLPIVAYFLEGAGRTSAAEKLYGSLLSYPFVAKSRWFSKVIGRKSEAFSNIRNRY